MNLITLILLVIVLAWLFGGLGGGWHSYTGGPYPYWGGGGLIVLVLVILLLTGRL